MTPLIDSLDSGALILTSTSRLARGQRLWPTPRILPRSAWLTEQWNEAVHTEAALSLQQHRFLWQPESADSPPPSPERTPAPSKPRPQGADYATGARA